MWIGYRLKDKATPRIEKVAKVGHASPMAPTCKSAEVSRRHALRRHCVSQAVGGRFGPFTFPHHSHQDKERQFNKI